MKKLSLLLLVAFLIGCGGGGGDGGGGTGTVSAPTFSPSPGVYTSAQSVTLSTSTPGASIRYTADGSTPSETVGTVYAGPIAVASSMTIRAVAYLSGWTTSSVSSGTYTITFTVSAPVFSPPPGAYPSAQSVTLSTSTPGASIRYTVDGSTPSDTVGTVYAGPIAVASSMTIRAVAYLSGWTTSTVSIGGYTIGAFSQPDITGTWDFISLLSGGNAGWVRATGAFDGSGNATTVSNYLDSAGGTTPGFASLRWTIDSTGAVSQFENNVFKYLGRMSSDKKLITWVGTRDASTHTVQMTIARKRTGTVFTNADLASILFSFHALASGADNNWVYGAGSFNASRQITITSLTPPPGYLGIVPPENFDTCSVSPEGIVTFTNDNTFYGFMTDDKKAIFTIREDVGDNINWIFVFMVDGQTFSQPDHDGIFSWASLRNFVPNPGWDHGVIDIDASGNGSYLSYEDSLGGGPSPSTFVRNLSSTGVITDPADATYHGQMSYNKDITIRTNTTGTRDYGLAISIR